MGTASAVRVECPACHYAAEVDASCIPVGGTNATCPRCKGTFFVAPPASTSTEQLCPKCQAAHDGAESCPNCGLIFAKYRAVQERRHQEAATTAPAPAQDVPPITPPEPSVSFQFGHGRGEILSWAEEGHLAPDDLSAALQLSGTLPGPTDWRRFLDGFALWLGGLLLALAVIFFFAYNWRELGHFARFGIVELLLAGTVGLTWWLGLERSSGKAALLVATLLVGSLFALIGQTYQTGADPWELFALWAACIVPWVAIARFAPLWLLEVALLNLAVGLYYRTFGGFFGIAFGIHTLSWALALLNSAALAVWELAASRGMSWLEERWPVRCVATLALGFTTLLAVWGILDPEGGLPECCGYLLFMAGAYFVYRRWLHDLYVLALGVLSLIVVITVFLAHSVLPVGDPGGSLFIGMVVLGLSAAGGYWLRAVAQEGEA